MTSCLADDCKTVEDRVDGLLVSLQGALVEVLDMLRDKVDCIDDVPDPERPLP
jgi:hypothetical protein